MKDLVARRQRWIRVRISILGALLLVGTGAIVKRAFELHVTLSPTLREMAEAQYLRDVQLVPKRGTVYDRNGAELAVSVEADSVWANPRELRRAGQNVTSIALELARVLSVDSVRTLERLQSNRYFVWIKRQVTPQQGATIRAMHIPGVYMVPEARRYYPNRELAAHVLGFADVDGRGIEGLELSANSLLRGTPRAFPMVHDRHGAIVFSEGWLDDVESQGKDLVLTLDKTIQHLVERELTLAVQTFEARGGSVVVMEPYTGDVLAMANYPSFNPNARGEAPSAHRRNRAITDRFEPGSTVKPFTVAAALAGGTIRPDQWINCENGAIRVAEYTIHDSHKFEWLTPEQVLAFSSNIGAAKIGESLGRRGLYRGLRGFGFGAPTGISLPGETGGILRHYVHWYDMDAATIAFGQGVSVTTLQLATAMAAIANGGQLLKPLLVKRVQTAKGDVVEESKPELVRQVVPAFAADRVARMLASVTRPGGTGIEAALDGYSVAGKTGTAQKADYIAGGYAENKWMVSFVGFVPVERPKLVIAAVLDEPMIAHQGGTVAAPLFRRVAQASLRYLGVTPRGSVSSVAKVSPALRGARGIESAATASQDTRTEAPSITPAQMLEGQTRVPDFEGLSARSAVERAQHDHLIVQLQGHGRVIAQEPPIHSVVAMGSRVRLILAPPFEIETSSTSQETQIAAAAGPAVHQRSP